MAALHAARALPGQHQAIPPMTGDNTGSKALCSLGPATPVETEASVALRLIAVETP